MMKINIQINKWIDTIFTSTWSIYLVLMISSIIVLVNIGRESLWLDEIFSATVALKVTSLHSMFTEFIFKDVHPPLYQIILYYWDKLFGDSDIVIRIMSYIVVLISFLFSFVLLNKYFSKRIAILFFVLSAFSPGVLYYAQEARPYGLLYAFSNIETILFVILMLKIKNDQNIKNILYIIYVSVGIFLCYTHYFGYILVFSLSIVLVIYSILLHRKKITLRLFIISFMIVTAGAFWLLVLFYFGDITDKTGGNFWIKNNHFDQITGVISLLFNSLKGAIIESALMLFIIFPLLPFVRSFKKHSMILFPILLVLFVSILISMHTPIVTTRNLIIIIPAILLFITFVFEDLFDKKKLIILLYLLLLLLFSIWNSSVYKKENWKGASQYILKNFDNTQCKVPVSSRIDRSIGKPFLIYPSYYLGTQYSYLLTGPKVQKKCDLIYFDGHKRKEQIVKDLIEYNISIPYKILDFNKVYVVIKK